MEERVKQKRIKKEVDDDVSSSEDSMAKELPPKGEELFNNTLSTIVLRSMQRIPYIELCKQVCSSLFGKLFVIMIIKNMQQNIIIIFKVEHMENYSIISFCFSFSFLFTTTIFSIL